MAGYSLWTSIRKGLLDGIKTAVASDAVLIGLTDSKALEAHVAALVTGAVTGLIRGLVNWYKNHKKGKYD